MTTYAKECERLKDSQKHQTEMLKKHRALFGIANRYAKLFGKTHKEMDINTSYVGFEPAVDIDVHIGEVDSFKETYPLVDMLIKEPRLEMTNPLPTTVEKKDTAITCSFRKKGSKSNFPKLRVYIHIINSQVCQEVGTGKFREITRVACGHYDDEGNFVEDK